MTAEASRPPATDPIGALITGWSMPSNSVSFVLITHSPWEMSTGGLEVRDAAEQFREFGGRLSFKRRGHHASWLVRTASKTKKM
ncbi:hypothetical protein GCM10010507_56470 [Streptomyces cinnamoneus]|uniref:Uncharacterized protein n=1 Tax=Streptomyces cinnamoneus TaxID=53446 RepID=A0A918WQX2_STRCJ|nr:hypothetical protein GCM10010507_56470 [Streptomyces cinnamoneus]